ncbi:MAG: hypothetical protein K1X64_03180 [Myxococcaceae bacterium]|nr:hypothetical protein [Myxococcaceae bacterium]
MRMMDTATGGATCALHPAVSASATCQRCGNFMCAECAAQGVETRCPACRQLLGQTGFPFERSNFDFGRLWGYAFERWQREWVMLSVAVLSMFAASVAVSLATTVVQGILSAVFGAAGDAGSGMAAVAVIGMSQLLGIILRVVIDGTLQLGFLRMLLDVLHGGQADIGRLISQFSKLPRYLLLAVVVGLIFVIPIVSVYGAALVVGLKSAGLSFGDVENFKNLFESGEGVWALFLPFVGATVLLIPFMFYVGMPLYFMFFELVHGDAPGLDALSRSFKIAKGLRFPIFGYGFMGGLVMVVGVLACLIGLLPAMALAQLLMGSLYLAARNGSGLPEPVKT